jgi:serine/threonine protein kinase
VAIESGQRLLHYRLIEKIGEGGMGVVWKAEDTTLGREVAIKVLPEAFTADADRLARFQREAKLLASLHHVNITGIFGAHEHDGVRFLAMEFVAGEDLSERIARGPLPIDDVLSIALQIAEALEAAHDNGIMHRDLKPANVKLTEDLKVKVLDFGLAKLDGLQAAPGGDCTHAPTVTSAGTHTGVILGTAPYMSPEQVRGKPVDKRTDIWALGCVIYECLAGRKPFDGDSTADVLAQIVTRNPDFEALPAHTPGFLVRLLHRCLEREPRRRLRDAGEVRVAIETFRSDPGADSAPAVSNRSWTPWAIVALLSISLVYALTLRGASIDTSPAISRWSISLPATTRVDLPGPGGKFSYSNTVAVSRDGSQVAFSVIDRENQVQLYLKSHAAEPQPIPGTTNARAPFFSPDGQWLGFYAGGRLWKTALRGGSPQQICDVGGRAISFDASWSPDGKSILFTDDGLWRVSVSDGVSERLTSPDPERGEQGHHAPRFMSDGQTVLFTVSGSGTTHLALMPLDGSSWEIIVRDAALGVPVGFDRIVFARSGELYMAPFDLRELNVTGPPVPVLQGVHTAPGLGGVVMTWFDVSDDGTLVYVPADVPRADEQLVWVDYDRNETLIAEGPGTWVHPRLSPDGTRISLDILAADCMRYVYLYDLERRLFQQLTHTGVTWESEWSPDGEFLVMLSGINPGKWSLYRIRSDFSGSLELIAPSDHAVPGSWVDDGRALLYTEWNKGGVYRLQVEEGGTPELLFETERSQGFPRVSHDGEWIAYVANEASRLDVFVQSYPEFGAVHKVSIEGGREPVWSLDGQRLFYRNGSQVLMVDVSYGSTISFGRPQVLFEGEYDAATVGHQHYDISHDGMRFLMVKHGEPVGPREVRVVLNWGEEMRALAVGP